MSKKRIRATLIHNADAGFEQCSTEELLGTLSAHGYDASHAKDLIHGLRDPGELVVCAGGDGTLRKAARHLVGRGIPIGIIPMGTANNIAHSLGIKGGPAEVIPAWDLKHRQAFDAGVVVRGKRERFFIESVGFGMFPRLIRQREDDEKKESREEELKDALAHQLKIFDDYPPHPATIFIDGEQLADEYLMVEVMNIRFAGPNLSLAPQASFDDGLLEVILVRKADRELMSDFLAASMRKKAPRHSFEIRQAKSLVVEWKGLHFHVDDKAIEVKVATPIGIHLIPKGLSFLKPPAS